MKRPSSFRWFACDLDRCGGGVTPLVVLGDASYSLYLTHPFAIRPMRNIWIVLQGGALPFGLFLLVRGLVAVTAVVYRLIEKPTTDALRRKSGGLRGGSPRRPLLVLVQPQSAAAGG